MPVFRIDDSIRDAQSQRLQGLRGTRDAARTAQCLEAVRRAATDGTNLMPPVIEAVENYCTLGEIADELRGVFGEYQ